MSVQVATRVSEELAARLRVLMEREQRSMGQLLRLALVAYVDRYEQASGGRLVAAEVVPPSAEQAERVVEASRRVVARPEVQRPVRSPREFRPYPKGG